MLNNLFVLACALFLLMKGATLATKYAARLAESFRLSKYTVGFIIIAVISILPETFIVANSALEGIPSFGLATLFGSNIADMTLIFAIIVALAGRGMKVESKILKNRKIYPWVILMPLLLGLDGYYGRTDGLVLIIAGAVFYYIALRSGVDNVVSITSGVNRGKSALMLLFGMTLLLVGSHFTVSSASALAHTLGVNPILIGVLVIGLGTTIPELLFAIKSVKRQDDSLAMGDILGTVLTDATVVVGIISLVAPFSFPQSVIYVAGSFMVAAAFLLFHFMHTGRVLSEKEAYFLFFFWTIFVLTEFFANTYLGL